jgi:hypothetical protein
MRRSAASTAAVAIALTGCGHSQLPHEDVQVLASVQALRVLLADPQGLRIMRAEQYQDGTICYTFRMRNAFGGFSDDFAVYDGADSVQLASLDTAGYAKHCLSAGTGARDVTAYANYGLTQ